MTHQQRIHEQQLADSARVIAAIAQPGTVRAGMANGVAGVHSRDNSGRDTYVVLATSSDTRRLIDELAAIEAAQLQAERPDTCPDTCPDTLRPERVDEIRGTE